MARKRIMVVDDEKNFLALLISLLKENGYSVIPAHNGKEALAKLKKTKPDLVLLDIMMPGMGGVEVCEKIRANPKTGNLKIIFLTVVPFSESGMQNLKKFNVLDYIVKPFENKDLLTRIKRALS